MSCTYLCEKGCCTIKVRHCTPKNVKYFRTGNRKKSGVFLYDPDQDRVLLVQSRGDLWGAPKGTVENETSLECAIREVKEETGLDIDPTIFQKAIRIKNRALYYYAEHPTTKVNVQVHEDDEKNDANGIGWIKMSCLHTMIKNGAIVLNNHTTIMFKEFMNITFPKSGFIKVTKYVKI